MPKEEPLDEAFYELKNIINMLQANLFKMVSAKEVKETESIIDQIAKSIDQFKEQSREELKGLGLTHEQKDMLNRGKVPDSITGEHRETLEMAIDLKSKIEDMKKIAHEEQGLFEEKEKKTTKQKNKEERISKQQHKKKFKRLGGDDWKPL